MKEWKKKSLKILLLLTNDERQNLKLNPLKIDDLKKEYNVEKWTKDAFDKAAFSENSILISRKNRRLKVDKIFEAAHFNTTNEFRTLLDEYKFNYAYNRPLVTPILNFCIIEGVMNKILNYTPTEKSYISFSKRWERFERYLVELIPMNIPKNKVKRLFKNIRNPLLHGQFRHISPQEKEFLNLLMCNLLTLDIENKQPKLLNGIKRVNVIEFPQKHRPIEILYRELISA